MSGAMFLLGGSLFVFLVVLLVVILAIKENERRHEFQDHVRALSLLCDSDGSVLKSFHK